MTPIISILMPCKNRTHDLKKTLPHIMDAGALSPPVEYLILDYGSDDDLKEYAEEMAYNDEYDENYFTYKSVRQEYYHMAHAWNLAAKFSRGKYLAVFGTDIIPDADYFKVVREKLAEDDYKWMRGKKLKGVLVCEREEFMNAGGYDERFELYGPEDDDLEERLVRRKAKFCLLPDLLSEITTAKTDKTSNYRITSRLQAKKIQKPIHEENIRNQVLVANEGKKWGIV